MARVIKGGTPAGPGAPKPARPATRVIVDAGAKKVIERELFAAKQDAEMILKRAEEERARVLADGKKAAAQAREEAQLRGASEAFAAAAAEALTAFRRRAERYGEAADDIRVLAREVVKKVLGGEPDLAQKDVERILHKGMSQLRARRRLRVQVPNERLESLAFERPNLMKTLRGEPDLLIESVDDVSVGFARVVTEIGGALCTEETALDALALAVNVKEQPRAPGQQGRVPTARFDAADEPSATGTGSDLPDASVEELDADEVLAGLREDGADDTLQMGQMGQMGQKGKPSIGRARPATEDDIPEIAADEEPDEDATHAMMRVAREAERRGAQRGDVKAPPRPATRVLPLDAGLPAPQDSTSRRAAFAGTSSEDASVEDDDLELFTDDAVSRPPRPGRTPGRGPDKPTKDGKDARKT